MLATAKQKFVSYYLELSLKMKRTEFFKNWLKWKMLTEINWDGLESYAPNSKKQMCKLLFRIISQNEKNWILQKLAKMENVNRNQL